MGVRSRTAAAAAGLLVVLACSANARAFASCPNDTTQPTPAGGARAAAAATAALVCDINTIRERRGLRPLSWNATVAGAAQSFAQEMAAQGFFSHVSPDGREPKDRIFSTGYFDAAAGWLVLENIDWGSNAYATPLATTLLWMQSTEHRANLLDQQTQVIGVGVAQGQLEAGGVNGVFYVADFAARSDRATVSNSAKRRRACTAPKRHGVHRKRHGAQRKRCRARTRV